MVGHDLNEFQSLGATTEKAQNSGGLKVAA